MILNVEQQHVCPYLCLDAIGMKNDGTYGLIDDLTINYDSNGALTQFDLHYRGYYHFPSRLGSRLPSRIMLLF